MNEMPHFEHQSLSKFPAIHQRFLFNSPWHSLLTQGCWQRIQQPLLDAQGQQQGFQQQLEAQFSKARQAGIAHPIVVGAIPFDAQQPSDLFIPEQVQRFSRAELQQVAGLKSASSLSPIQHAVEHPGQPEFMAMVADAVRAMQQGQLDKVVLSRLLQLTTEQPLAIESLLATLVTQNPDGYHFHHPLAEGSVLTGASPELLLRKQGAEYSSCPLAGSAKRQTCAEQDQATAASLMNSAKDRHEHQLVIDGMRRVLEPESIELKIPNQPSLLTTATLWHLASEIQGRLPQSTDNALRLAALLHPTPALSGFPHQAACQLIKQLEPFDRQWFGGMVGWCDDKGNGEWVVTIRCAKVKANSITLFAGAGIVESSSPLSEWQETGTKLNTLLRALQINPRKGSEI